MAKLFANDTIGLDYKEQLRKEHDGSKWGSTGFRYSGEAIERLVHRYRPSTGLDYGCGKGEVSVNVVDVDWTNYDPGIPGIDEKPPYGKKFDIVVCTDVMEHVEEQYVDEVIKDLMKYTGTVLFVDIACYLTGKTFGEGPYKGQDLHITVMSPDLWIARFEELASLQLLEAKNTKKLSKGEYKDRLELIYERI